MPTTTLNRRSGLDIDFFPLPDSGQSVNQLGQPYQRSWTRADAEFLGAPLAARQHQLLLPQVTSAGTYAYSIDKRGALVVGGSNTAALRALNSVEVGVPTSTTPTARSFTGAVSGTAGKARLTIVGTGTASYNVGELVTLTGTYVGTFAILSIDSISTLTIDTPYVASTSGTITAPALTWSFGNLRNFELTLINSSASGAAYPGGGYLRAGINATLKYGYANSADYSQINAVTTNVFPLQVTDPGQSSSITCDLPAGSIFYSLDIAVPLYAQDATLTFTGLAFRTYVS